MSPSFRTNLRVKFASAHLWHCHLALLLMGFDAQAGANLITCEAAFRSTVGELDSASSRRVRMEFKMGELEGVLVQEHGEILPDGLYRWAILLPSDGVGRVTLYRSVAAARSVLWQVALDFPWVTQRFGILASASTLAIPNDVRLNHNLNTDRPGLGLRFEDVPTHLEQHYTARFFFQRLLQNRIPLATHGPDETHDRAGEHLLGALAMPEPLVRQFLQKAKFYREVESLPEFAESQELQELMRGSIQSLSDQWDGASAVLGAGILDYLKTREPQPLQQAILEAQTLATESLESIHHSPLIRSPELKRKIERLAKVAMVERSASPSWMKDLTTPVLQLLAKP